MGHTAVGFLEDDRLQVPAVNVPDDAFACIAHNTYEENLESIIVNGLLPGGGGITDAVHSQLSAVRMGDNRLQESSRGSTTTAVIHFSILKTKPFGQHLRQWLYRREEQATWFIHRKNLGKA